MNELQGDFSTTAAGGARDYRNVARWHKPPTCR